MPWYDPGPPILPRATAEQIFEAERKLGFTLPPLLKSIYLEIGNGGWNAWTWYLWYRKRL